MPEPTHYRLDSAMEIEGTVQAAGSIIIAEQFKTLTPEAQAMLLEGEHVIPCDAPRDVKQAPPSPFPRKPSKAKTE